MRYTINRLILNHWISAFSDPLRRWSTRNFPHHHLLQWSQHNMIGGLDSWPLIRELAYFSTPLLSLIRSLASEISRLTQNICRCTVFKMFSPILMFTAFRTLGIGFLSSTSITFSRLYIILRIGLLLGLHWSFPYWLWRRWWNRVKQNLVSKEENGLWCIGSLLVERWNPRGTQDG